MEFFHSYESNRICHIFAASRAHRKAGSHPQSRMPMFLVVMLELVLALALDRNSAGLIRRLLHTGVGSVLRSCPGYGNHHQPSERNVRILRSLHIVPGIPQLKPRIGLVPSC
jgi:hypothetical protein